MKRNIALLLLALLLSLAGCNQCEHQWSDADCDTPKTCSLCGETEGDALGHAWQAADCVTAKTCVVCQETEGKPLGHGWKAADCLNPQTCTVCNVTEGEALGHRMLAANFQEPPICFDCGYAEGECLPPKYTQYPVEVINVQLGVEYDYHTVCHIYGHSTVGKLRWDDYQVFAGDDTYPAAEGYEWHRVTVRITFSDRNAKKYGVVVQSALDDYYWYLAQSDNGYTDSFTVSYNGTLYDQCLRANGQGSMSEWADDGFTYTATFAWRVPVGYNGHLILFYHTDADLEEALTQGDDSILVFRFAK